MPRYLSDAQPDLPLPHTDHVHGPAYKGPGGDFTINTSDGAFSNNADYLQTGEVHGFHGDGDYIPTEGPRTYQG